MQACFLKNSDVSRSEPLGSVKPWGRKKRGEIRGAAARFSFTAAIPFKRCLYTTFFLCSPGCGKNQTYFSIYGRVVPAPMLANMNTYMQFRHDET